MSPLEISFREFEELVQERPCIAYVSAEIDTDVTPLAAYSAMARGREEGYSFLLESGEKSAHSATGMGEEPISIEGHAQYSFVGYDPDAVVTIGGNETEILVLKDSTMANQLAKGEGDVLDILKGAVPRYPLVGFPNTNRQQLLGGLIGFLSYEAVYDLWLREVGVQKKISQIPDAQFVVNTKTIIFDHNIDKAHLAFTPLITEETDLSSLYESLCHEVRDVMERIEMAKEPETGEIVIYEESVGSKQEYESAVKRVIEYVKSGDIYQGVLSRKREIKCKVNPLELYASLKSVNPSPYMYLLKFNGFAIVGASPETLISIKGNRVISNPIAGTCARGKTTEEDFLFSQEMLSDKKELSEHTMLVDLARNDVRRVCLSGTVEVEEFMNVLKYSHVQHIESTVTGELDSKCTSFDATRATFPAGTLSGAPKIRAMEIIDELESAPRGVYGGGIGYYSWEGDADFAIVIRTATIEMGDIDTITIQAGAGIVADSIPEKEYEETEKKMHAVRESIYRLVEEDQEE
tara:strand:+ start:2919 stop:4481 length:1563 start_codon:yes stop_codon:yes gene_type:complete